MNCKPVICKLHFPVADSLLYNVQLWYEYTPGQYAYAGNGRYFETLEDARAYAAEKGTVPAEEAVQ